MYGNISELISISILSTLHLSNKKQCWLEVATNTPGELLHISAMKVSKNVVLHGIDLYSFAS